MGTKTNRKTKRNASHLEAATFGKKEVGAKTFHHGKSGKIHGLKTAGAVATRKSKATYPGHTSSPLKIKDSGLPVSFAVYPETGTENAPQEQEAELADKLVTEVAESGADVKELCETYSLKREELGRLTGFSLRALAEWAGGKLPSQPAKRRLREVRRLLDALAELAKRESIPRWLHQPNRALGGLTPLQVIELGEIDRLWTMVHDLGSGQPE